MILPSLSLEDAFPLTVKYYLSRLLNIESGRCSHYFEVSSAFKNELIS